MAQILVVDDSHNMCRAMVRIASHFGHTAQFVESGQAALDYLARRLPDLVLLDLMMPGLAGLDVLRTIRANPKTSSLPVIIHSAVSEPSRIAEAMSAGANDYWIKSSIELRFIEQSLARYLQTT
jgi:CheY-like chemotaxis protein